LQFAIEVLHYLNGFPRDPDLKDWLLKSSVSLGAGQRKLIRRSAEEMSVGEQPRLMNDSIGFNAARFWQRIRS
jgi:hypothetical protein